MAIFGQYTGQRVGALPSGFLGAAMLQAAATRKSFSEAGTSIGDAIEGYGRQKQAEKLRLEKIHALAGMFTSADTKASMISPEALHRAAAEDKAMTGEVQNQWGADRALALGAIDKRKKVSVDWVEDRRGYASDLRKAASDSMLEFTEQDTEAKSIKVSRLRKRVKRLGEIERAARKAGNPSSARVKQMNSLREQADALEKPGDSLLEKIKALTSDAKELEWGADFIESTLTSFDDEKAALLEKYKEPPVVTAAMDEIYDKPWEQSQLQVTEKGQLEADLAHRIGPKLLKKMASGDMNKGEELLLIDVLENYQLEQREARSPKAQLTQMQLDKFSDQRQRQQALSEMPSQFGPATRTQLAPENVTIDRLMQDVQSGKMTAAEAIQREEAIVDRVNRLGGSQAPAAGMPALPGAQVDERILKDWVNLGDNALGGQPRFPARTRPEGEEIPAAPGHDYYNPDAYKTNRGFQRRYGPEGQNYSDDQQRRVWMIEKETHTINAPKDVPPPTMTPAAPAAPPMEMMQQFEREVQVPVAEQKQRAMDWLSQSGITPGTAEHTAAASEITRRFGPAVEIKRIEGANLVLVDGQYKAAIPVTKGKGIVGVDSVRIPGTNRIQPVQTNVDGTMTPMGDSVEVTDGQIDREFKVDVLGPNAFAMHKQRADQLRQQVSDIQFANDSVSELIELSELTGEEAKLKARGIAKSLTATMIGRLRVTLMGPGVLSNQDVERVMQAIPDPTKILAFDAQEVAALRQTLRSLKEGLKSDIGVHIEGGLDNVRLPSWLSDSGGGGVGTPSRYGPGPPPAFIRGKGGKLQPAPIE